MSLRLERGNFTVQHTFKGQILLGSLTCHDLGDSAMCWGKANTVVNLVVVLIMPRSFYSFNQRSFAFNNFKTGLFFQFLFSLEMHFFYYLCYS